MADLDHLLRSDISHAAQDAAKAPDFAAIERRGVRRRRTRTAIAVAAAVTALVAALGGLQLTGVRQAVPASPPSTMTVVSTPPPMPSGDTAIDPGTYRVPRSTWSAAEYTVSFPAGWTLQEGHLFSRHPADDHEFGYRTVVVDGIYSDSCTGDAGAVRPVGPSSADLVAALLAQPGTDATGPVATTLGGRPATRIDLRVPKDLNLATCTHKGLGLQIWHSTPADDYLVVLPDGTASVYVLDVDGKRTVFITQVRAATSTAERAELQTVLASIRFPRHAHPSTRQALLARHMRAEQAPRRHTGDEPLRRDAPGRGAVRAAARSR